MIINILVALAAVVGIAWGIHAQHREMQRMHMQIRMAHAWITELLEDERRRQRAESAS